jgi:hypothetical protein
MSQTEPEPSQSTEMFRAFVDRDAADRHETVKRRIPAGAIVAIVAIVVVLAIVVWLVF